MTAVSEVTIRHARRDDLASIIAMLADDPLGGARERIEDPLPQVYFEAFERVQRDPNIQLVVAEDGEGAVIGCLQLCILPGVSSQGASRGLIEDVRVASALPQPRHRRAAGAMGRVPKRAQGVASWSNCSRITPASMRNGFTSGSGSPAAMSA